MTRRVVGLVGAALAGFTASGYALEYATGRPHGRMVLGALAVGLTATAAAKLVEWLTARRGAEAVVLGYWVCVGVRGLVALTGAVSLAEFAFDPQDRHAWLLWLLAVYLAALAFETVRSVRAADLASVAIPGSGGGPNE